MIDELLKKQYVAPMAKLFTIECEGVICGSPGGDNPLINWEEGENIGGEI